MKIAICDDNLQELHHLVQLIEQYKLRSPSLEIEAEHFISIEQLLKQATDKYDLLILDILMPQINGLEYVRALRTSGCQAAVIFVTSSPDFALDAFSVNATQYLMKPLHAETLYQALDTIIASLQLKKASSIVVSSPQGLKTLYYHNIKFVECTRHLAYFHLSDNSVVCSRTLRQSFLTYIAPILTDPRFIQPHYSFCINKDYVTKLNQKNFELHGGHIVPISKDRFTKVKADYLNYLDHYKEV